MPRVLLVLVVLVSLAAPACTLHAIGGHAWETQPKAARVASYAVERGYAFISIGAVRSMMYENVMKSMLTQVVEPIKSSKYGGDIFYYLFVGRELSARGQQALSPSVATQLAAALAHATVFQLQYEENLFTCGQQTTGKFYKVAQAAKMAREYEDQNNIRYKAFVFSRPDILYSSPFVDVLSEPCRNAPGLWDQIRKGGWYMQVIEGDVWLTSREGLDAAERLGEAECCDLDAQTPKECFPSQNGLTLPEPRANFILEEHFKRHPLESLASCWDLPLQLVRTPDMNAGAAEALNDPAADASHVWELHGKFHDDVDRKLSPARSGPVRFGSSGGGGGGSSSSPTSILEGLLHAPELLAQLESPS